MSETHTRELMMKYFPKCPICGSEIGYTISPSFHVVQCNSCKVKFMSDELRDPQKDLTHLSLFASPSSLHESVMPMLDSVENKVYPLSFWKDFGANLRKQISDSEEAEKKKMQTDYKVGVEKLAIMFSKGEISEEAYKTSVSSLEKQLHETKIKLYESKLKKETELSDAKEVTEPTVKEKETSKKAHLLLYGLGVILLLFGLILTTIPLPASQIDAAYRLYQEISKIYGGSSQEAIAYYKIWQALGEARPYAVLGGIIALIGVVALVSAFAIGRVSAKTSP